MSNQNLAEYYLEKEIKQLTSTSLGRRTFVSSLPFLLAACATGSKHRNREGDNTGQHTDISVSDEQKMAREYLPQMKKEYPPIRDPTVQSFIRRVGNNIVAKNGLRQRPYNYTFTVVKSKMVNAFALPAGTVFVTAPLIAMADTEAELAGVVGHEIGHIKARHTAERISKQKSQQSKDILYGIGGALLGGVAGYGLGKMVCKKQDKECLRRIAMYGGMAGGAGALLIRKFGFMANSREDEMEADRIGFRTSNQAGYHPEYVGKFYSKLLAMEKQYQKKPNNFLAPFTDAMSTHPPSPQRVSQMSEMANAIAPKRGDRISSREFESIKRKLS
jgi:predicted Zn-dependent protease